MKEINAGRPARNGKYDVTSGVWVLRRSTPKTLVSTTIAVLSAGLLTPG
jgi:hypothetical protein